MKIVVCFITICVLFILGGLIYQLTMTKLDFSHFPHIGELIDIGGYSLHLNGSGKGPTSVILESGLGGNCLEWSLVQPEIAKFARVYSYDRAGLGWSDESPLSRTSINIVEELHALLQKANIPKPYILVGHSFGGVNVRLYAHQYPEEVAGLVLVDSSHEDQEQRCPINPIEESFFFNHPRLGTFLAAMGFTRLAMKNPKIIAMLKIGLFPKEIQDYYLATQVTVKCTRTNYHENHCFSESLQQLKKVNSSLGEKFLTIISAGQPGIAEAYGPSQEWLDLAHEAWKNLQKELALLSKNSVHIIADNSDHLITRNRPDLIVEAVHAIIKKVNNERGVQGGSNQKS